MCLNSGANLPHFESRLCFFWKLGHLTSSCPTCLICSTFLIVRMKSLHKKLLDQYLTSNTHYTYIKVKRMVWWIPLNLFPIFNKYQPMDIMIIDHTSFVILPFVANYFEANRNIISSLNISLYVYKLLKMLSMSPLL